LNVAKAEPNNYLRAMFKPFEFSVPTRATIVPSGPGWLHEVKELREHFEPSNPRMAGGANVQPLLIARP
jgi:hypothetical protein